jgi:hypothetical protein
MVVVEDLPQVAIDLDDHSLVQVACRNHGSGALLRVGPMLGGLCADARL